MCYTKMKMSKKLLVWCLILVAVTATAAAAEDVDTTEASTKAVDVADIQTISFPKDIRIQDALRVLAQKYQRNIVPSPNVDGVLGFTRLFDVTFDEAMSAILGASFKYEAEGQLIRVYTRAEYQAMKADVDRMEYKTFTLYYLTAAEAVQFIQPVLSGAAKVEATETAKEEITGGGESVGGGAGGGSGSDIGGGGGGDSFAINDTIIIFDYPENIAKAEEVIKSLDIRPKQVLVEATILSATLTEGMELGVDLNFMAGFSLDGSAATDDLTTSVSVDRGSAATLPIDQISGVSGTPIETSGFAKVGGDGLRIGVSSGDFRMFITALEAITDTTVLANPKILTVNKQEGSVLIGTNLGYRSSTTISSAGVASEGEVEFLQTGTQLVFRPYIGDNGYIRMDIYPKDSSAELNADGVPTEVTTQLRTNIVVKDGETIVLGGLFRDVVSSGRKQIPLLGDIPLIGSLFRSSLDASRREEVIILLTPHIIDAADQTNGLAREADISRKSYGSRGTLQGIGRTRLAEGHYLNAVKSYTDGDSVAALSQLDDALDLRPTYLEALRLKERITGEVTPQDVSRMERIMLQTIEREESALWRRQ